jgi:hypothetical protein
VTLPTLPHPADEVLDAEEVAAIVKHTPRWIRESSAQAGLVGFRVGRYRRWRRSDVLDWIEKQATAGRTAW